MALSTSCCLNLSPPPPSSSPSSVPTKATQVAWPKKERSWRSQCVLGVACMIIGLEVDCFIGSEGMAIADQVINMQPVVESNEKGGHKWSDKRMCPPWRLNSLETIVPENLPRPSARRRWETVAYPRVAPAVKVVVLRSNNGSCFTM